jgi:deaminated glutathione amidase
MSDLKLGFIQMSSGEDVSENLKNLEKSFNQITSKESVDLVISPENSLFMRVRKSTPITGFSLDDGSLDSVQSLVERAGVSLILGSIPLKTKTSRFKNAMVLISPSKRPEVVYEKLHLFDVDVEGQPPVRESEIFEPGPKPEVLLFKNFKIGLSICYDLRFSELYAGYAKQQVDLILVPSAFLVPTGRAHWEVLLRARAIESQCYVVAPAQGGISQGADEAFRETYGHSMAVDPWGKVLIELDQDDETGIVKIERAKLNQVRAQIPMKDHRRL